MPTSWQTQDHKVFIDEHFDSYVRSGMGKKEKEFWSSTFLLWFERWPLSNPPAKVIEKEGTLEKGKKAWREKEIAVSITQQHPTLA